MAPDLKREGIFINALIEDLSESMQKELEFERICDFFSKTKNAYMGLIFNMTVTSLLIRPYTTEKAIILWFLLTFVFYIPRIIITVQFFRSRKANRLRYDNMSRWEKLFYFNSILPFAAFSSVAFMPFEGNVLAGVAITGLALVALLSGGVMIYSSSLRPSYLWLSGQKPGFRL